MAARFSRAELATFQGATVDDLMPPADRPLRLLFVGINPGLWTAATNAHFARKGNRFWPALHRAGITPWLVDASSGMSDEDTAMMLERGIGITNVVEVATARADEVTAAQFRAGGRRLELLVRDRRPTVVAVLGLTAYRAAFERAAVPGRQPEPMGESELWVLPNPSGLNAHETLDSLADAYRRAAVAAGVVT